MAVEVEARGEEPALALRLFRPSRGYGRLLICSCPVGSRGGVIGAPLAHVPKLYHTYFQRLFQAASQDEEGIQAQRKEMNYPEVAARFRLIKDDTASVVVRYEPQGEEVDRLLGVVRSGGAKGSLRRALGQLQPFVINVRRRELREHREAGRVAPVLAEAEVWEWLGEYDPQRGLLPGNQDPERLVV